MHKHHYDSLVNRLSSEEKILGQHPLNVQIQTVSICNADCFFCPYQGSWHRKNPGGMSDETFENIIQGLKSYTINKFCPYFENEPLADNRLFDRMEYALKELSPKWIEMSTNLSLLNDKKLERIIDIFRRYPHELVISFHGTGKENYEEIMSLKYERALTNVDKVLTAAQEYDLNVRIHGMGTAKVTDRRNWFTEEEYKSFWEEKIEKYAKKPNIVFYQYHDRASGSELLKERSISFDQIYRKSLKDFYCERFDQWVHFLYTGEPVLCCMDYHRETAFGETAQRQTIDELYSSSYYRNLLKEATGINKSKEDFICKRCVSPGG